MGMTGIPLAILAGGEGRRLGGSYKAKLRLCGKPLLLHVLESLAPSFSRVIIVVHEEKQREELSGLVESGAAVVRDCVEVRSPLAGIYTAAHEFARGFFAVAPVDTPFLRPTAYSRMLVLAKNYDAVVPLWPNGYLEPLIAIYRAEKVLETAPTLLAKGDGRVQALLKSIRSYLAPVSEVFDDPALEAFNVNTRHNLARAEAICSGKDGYLHHAAAAESPGFHQASGADKPQ